MAKPEKVEKVEELRAKISAAKAVYFADFQGMDVAQATELRNRCREAGVVFEVVKNTLTRRAVEEGLVQDLDPYLQGPTAIATSEEDEVIPAKIIADFVKEFERPVLKAGILEGRVMGKAQVQTLAQLPGRDVLLSRFVGGLKSPVQKLHMALSSPLQKLALVLKQIAEKQEA